MYKYRRVIVGAIAVILALLLVGGIVFSVFAESSSTIKARIEGLKEQEAAIAAQQKEIQKQKAENESDIRDLVSEKNSIDQQIKLTQDSIETKNELIREYTLLIAEKQNELEDALDAQDALNARYKTRIRSMEENGNLTYWSILFKASSFSDMLSRVDMINEIARADSKMIEQIQEVAQQIETARQELAVEKVELEQAREGFARVIESLKATPLPAAEVSKAANQIRGDYYRGHQTIGSRSSEAASLGILGQPLDLPRTRMDAAASVTPEQLQRLARTYLDVDMAYVVTVTP